MTSRPRVYETLAVVSNNPEVLQGQTVFAGTRVPLDALLAYRRKGRPVEEFLLDFPTVERWQAEAAWQLDDEEITRTIRRGARSAR